MDSATHDMEKSCFGQLGSTLCAPTKALGFQSCSLGNSQTANPILRCRNYVLIVGPTAGPKVVTSRRHRHRIPPGFDTASGNGSAGGLCRTDPADRNRTRSLCENSSNHNHVRCTAGERYQNRAPAASGATTRGSSPRPGLQHHPRNLPN